MKNMRLFLNGFMVEEQLIMVKANFLYDGRCQEGKQGLFKAADGWLKFMRQNGLSVRRKTATAQQDLHRAIDKMISYILLLVR